MDISISLTKVIAPSRRAQLVDRPRLLDFFNSIIDIKLFIISAQAGYGKTSLLTDYVSKSDMPICWLSLDSSDENIIQFVAHFIEAISYRFPEYGEKSRASINFSDGSFDVQHVVTSIINEIFATIDQHFVLILDDYHLIDANSMIEQFINRFILDMHENVHVIISSRKLVNIKDIALLAARGQVDGLDFSDLAFQVNEVQTLINQNQPSEINISEIENLVNETEGWITGLLLTTKLLADGYVKKSLSLNSAGVSIYEFLAKQILDQQSDEVQEFLMYTSILEEFNAEFCNQIFGDPPGNNSWKSLIEIILKENLFVVEIDGEDYWIRYHHLFRDFLQVQFEISHPNEITQLLNKIAVEYTKQKKWQSAYDYLKRTGNVKSLADYIESISQILWDSGRFILLQQWISSLPKSEIDSRPLLQVSMASIACGLGNFDEGFEYFKKAEEIFSAAGDQVEIARLKVNRASWHNVQGNYLSSIKEVEELSQLISGKSKTKRIRAEAIRAKGVSLGRLGKLDKGINLLQEAIVLNKELGLMSNVANCYVDLGIFLRMSGDYDSAIKIYQKGISIFETTNDFTSYALQLNNLGVLYHFIGNIIDAKKSLEKSLSLAKKIGRPRIEAMVLASIGDLYLDLDAIEAAENAFIQAEYIERVISNTLLRQYLELSFVKTSRMRKNYVKAKQLLSSISHNIDENSALIIRGMMTLELGLICLSENNLKVGLDYLKTAIRIFEVGGRKSELAQAKIYLANAYFINGESEKSIKILIEAIEIANTINNFYQLASIGKELSQFLEFANSQQNENYHIKKIMSAIKKFNLELPFLRKSIRSSESFIPFASPKIIIKTFGKEKITLDGELVNSPEWKPRKNVRDLFYLLLNSPQGLTKQGIGLQLWPEISAKKLNLNFKNAMYRLRKALGQNVINLDNHFYSFNFSLDYVWDVEEFLQMIENASSNRVPKEKIKMIYSVIEKYQGDYLPSVNHLWVVPHREKYYLYYRSCIIELGHLLLADNNPKEVLVRCWDLLSIDPFLEEANNLIMQAHAKLGNRQDVKKQYLNFENLLKQELGVPLSDKTINLYKALLN